MEWNEMEWNDHFRSDEKSVSINIYITIYFVTCLAISFILTEFITKALKYGVKVLAMFWVNTQLSSQEVDLKDFIIIALCAFTKGQKWDKYSLYHI